MAYRLLKIILPVDQRQRALTLLEDQPGLTFWQEESAQGFFVASLVMDSGDSETVMDLLEKTFSYVDGFRLVLMPIEATIPRMEKEERPNSDESGEVPGQATNGTAGTNGSPNISKWIGTRRISREELYADVLDGSELTSVFIALTILSTVVAAIGLVKSNVAIIIGAMVIAPFLGPNVALAFSTTLADVKLGFGAVRTLLVGVALVLLLSVSMGAVLGADPQTPEIAARTRIDLSDLILAIASGAAGVLAFTTGFSSALIGVMVAVALLPPLTVCGLLLGAGHFMLSISAFLLFLTNIICVNFAGVVTFFIQGVSPRTWWAATKAKKATRKALILWSLILILLIVVILLWY